MPLVFCLIFQWKVVRKDQKIYKYCLENAIYFEQNSDASTFNIKNITEFYCTIGVEFCPDDRLIIISEANNYNEAFKELIYFEKEENGILDNNNNVYINL